MVKSTPKSGSPGQRTLLSFFTPGKPKKEESSQTSSEGLTTPPLTSEDIASSPLKRKGRRSQLIDSDDEDVPLSKTPKYEEPEAVKREATLDDFSSSQPEPQPKSNALEKFASSSSYVAELKNRKVKNPPPVVEQRYQWLLDVKDADKNPEGSPDYDSRTLFIPSAAWAGFTAFEKQYWEIKRKLWDTIVFFKKGKFYELYEKDALIGHAQFDLRLAGGGRANMACAGIPEMSFDYWASAFIGKGYKVARVDQKETALAKEMRDQSLGKKEEKIIRRELSFILTAGTLTDETMLVDDLSQFCMAIKQEENQFAVAFVDTSTGAFRFARFKDDDDLNQFETLIAQTRPRELVVARNNLSRWASRIIKNNSSVDTLWNVLKPGDEFWDADTTKYELAKAQYFAGEDIDDVSRWPADLKNADELMLSAFGGLMWYLKSLKLERQLISLGNFGAYKSSAAKSMVLNGQTLQNLEIFANTFDQSSEGTLFRLINKCVTPFGKRRLKSWVSHPLNDLAAIAARQEVVDMFLNQLDFTDSIKSQLSGIADVERLLSRIHAGSLRPKDFARVLHALDRMQSTMDHIAKQDLGLKLIDELVEAFPSEASELVAEWYKAFDHAQALEKDLLIPEDGVESEFDETKQVITSLEQELEQHLKKYRKEFSTLSICFRDSGKEIYLIEVPVKLKVPKEWQQMGSTSKVKRYWSPEVKQLVRQLQEAREIHKLASDKVQSKLYARFMEHYEVWLQMAKVVANIDCLLSLAITSSNMPDRCKPVFKTGRTHLKFKDLRHPCNTQFIPNDIELGGPESKMSLLTGANAAGKSTILRSTGCAVILAQLGSYVPAKSAELTPVDRILTRLGANDNIFAGKSTFHVELSETQRILTEATDSSLVVIDELGRGGSSSDGFAIAEACLHQLATHVGCVGFFATHYGTLYNSFTLHPEVKPERMAIFVDKGSRQVTFLYKLEAGQSEGSFGMNVAKMCGVDEEIVQAAEKAAQEYEHTQRLQKIGYQGIPIGLESDVVWAQTHVPCHDAVKIMLEISKKLN